MLYNKPMRAIAFVHIQVLFPKVHLLKMNRYHAHFTQNLEIFLRRVRAALLVHNVSASEHNLNSDNNRDELAHLRSGGGDD